MRDPRLESSEDLQRRREPLRHGRRGPARSEARGQRTLPGALQAHRRAGKPVICAVGGHCLAGAFGLALACDLIVASDRATFGTPEINVGVFPFMIAALIYRNLPRKKATELMLLGERIDANEAAELGIVNRVVAHEELDAAVEAWALRLAAKSPLLMRLGKNALWRQSDLAVEPAWDFLQSQLTIAFSTHDMSEGVNAFFEKREPVWTG